MTLETKRLLLREMDPADYDALLMVFGDPETMWPTDDGVEILGASSDHLMLDVTDARREYRVGDTVQFRLGYYSLLRCYTSSYVEKEYI